MKAKGKKSSRIIIDLTMPPPERGACSTAPDDIGRDGVPATNRGRLRTWVERIVKASLFGVLVVIAFVVAEQRLDETHAFPGDRVAAMDCSVRVLAADGSWLRVTPTAAGERRLVVSLDEVSPHVLHALVGAEDRRFYSHSGVDLIAVARASLQSLGRGRIVSGASTLTMQLARLIEPHPRTLAGKVRETIRARQLERSLDKREILEHYLNLAPWGGTLRGIEAASRCWFGKPARDLDPSEAAMLVAMLPAPSRRSPAGDPFELRYHRDRLLRTMHEDGHLDDAAYRKATERSLGAWRHGWTYRAPHACDHLLAASRAGSKHEVRTNIDLDLQSRVERIVAQGDGAGVDGVGVVVLDRDSEAILAMLGSRDYRAHPLNATTRRRSPGSTLKPFLYALAIDEGLCGIDSLVLDTPGSFSDYRPRNYDESFRGPMRMAEALRDSRNLPAVRLLAAVGVDRFRDVLTQAGLRLPGHSLDLGMALGAVEVSPLELARATARLYRPRQRSLGIGLSARAQIFDVLAREAPCAAIPSGTVSWKTGTSTGHRDAWSVGVTRTRVIVVWLGRLSGAPDPNLVGRDQATRLMAEIAAAARAAHL